MNLKNSQQEVDNWIKEHGVRYFNELTNMAQLTEEVGEVARIIARRYGEQSEKESDKNKDLGEELADVVFVVLCLANVTLSFVSGAGLTERSVARKMVVQGKAGQARKTVDDQNLLRSPRRDGAEIGVSIFPIHEKICGFGPTAHLKGLMDLCKKEGVRVIFVQPEFDRRNAEIIAKQTGTRVISINPLSYDWEEEMLTVARSLRGDPGYQ
jgi:NTP pyrophosphatase (non-canonical NTP hydrolase)